MGYDIHRLVKRRKLVLGGVVVPSMKGLAGHSDGDVLLHALTDALLGSVGGGDIGDYFSDKDPKWKGADSRRFVALALDVVKKKGFSISNVDTVLVMETPKLYEHKQKIRVSVAQALHIPVSAVSVKAKTNEGMGAIGQGKAIACYAVVGVEKK